MTDAQSIVIPYRPRPLQKELHRQIEQHNRAVIVCHRRFGKSVMAINHAIKSAMQCQLDAGRYAYIAPTYAQGKAIAWDFLKFFSRPIPGTKINETELRIDYPNGARIRIFGTDNPDSLRGMYLDGAILDEYALMRPSVFTEIIGPALADRRGWAYFIGTPKGKNHFYDLYQYAQANGWFTAMYKASDTGVLEQAELDGLRKIMSEEEYAQEMECSWEGSLVGAYYSRQIQQARAEGRICHVPHVATLPVSTYWDLGFDDATAIWFIQIAGGQIRVIDYYESSGEPLAHYVKTLRDRPYVYGDHYLPHDVEVQELGTGKSRREVLESLGLTRIQTVPALDVQDGIEAVRAILNRCWFDAERCKDGIKALENYQKHWDEKRKVYRAQPLHNWAEHGSSAFRYFAVSYKDPIMTAPSPSARKKSKSWLAA